MKLACNIDKRGRKARLMSGSVIVLCGLAGLLTGRRCHSSALLTAGILLALAGSFMIFEGVRGWCALRAMGVKTRL